MEQLEARLVLTNFFVSASGNDFGPGSETAPWRTLQQAASVVQPGDHVLVRPGSYAGFNLLSSGSATARITFRAEPGAVIDQPLAFSGNRYGINGSGKEYVTIEGFTFAPRPNDPEWYSAIRLGGTPGAWVRGNVIRNNTAQMRVVGQSATPDKYGLYASWNDGLVIENNVVSGTYNSLIYVTENSRNYAVRGNRAFNGGGNGLHNNAGSNAPGVIRNAVIENNVIYNVGFGIGGQAISCDGVQDSRIQNNLIYDAHSKGISLYAVDAAEGCQRVLVANNTVLIRPGGYVPLRITEYSSHNTIINNIFYAPTPTGGWVDIEEPSAIGMICDYNVTTGVSLVGGVPRNDWYVTYGFDAHSLVSNPAALFVDSANANFHLRAGSPAINLGTSGQAPPGDLEGAGRPAGGGWDAGAYEFAAILPLRVTELTVTDSGFVARFNVPFDPAGLNVFDQGGALGPADVSLIGDTTGVPVAGSVVLSPDNLGFTFVKTGAPLVADYYTVRLRSAANGFKRGSGALLDGNGDGASGDDYVANFRIAPPGNARVVRLPDFTRGHGQTNLTVPNASVTPGVPLTLSDARTVQRVEVTLVHNSSLLTVTGFTVNPAIAGGTATFDPLTGTLVVTAPQAFTTSDGAFELGRFTAHVPETAPYGAKQVLDLRRVQVVSTNGTELPSLGDDAVHVASYLGDTTGNRFYQANDAGLTARAVAQANSGFAAHPLTDPVLIADVSPNGVLQPNDTELIQHAVALLPVADIPSWPPGGNPPTPAGPNSRMYVPRNLTGIADTRVTIPVRLEVTEAGIALAGFDVAVSYDPTKFSLVSNSIQLGGLASGFGLTTNIATPGVLFLTAYSTTGTTTLPVGTDGVLFTFDVTIASGVAVGESPLNLRANFQGTTPTGLFNTAFSQLTLAPVPTNSPDDAVDGVLTVQPPPQPGSLQFSSTSYVVSEDGGTATILVTRTNGSASQVTVDYATANGTATAGSDYASTSGTLTFAEGEVQKTVAITITNDTLDEDDETIFLTLANASGGATLGQLTTATLTILDDDTNAEPPPITIEPDPLDATKTALVVTGTEDADVLLVEPASSELEVVISYNGVLSTWPMPTGHVILRGLGGDDFLSLPATGVVPGLLFGGPGSDVLFGGPGNDQLLGDAGNDLLFAGSGDDVVVGGAGDDVMFGQDGQDLMIGSAGFDVLFADAGSDILIGGWTAFDANVVALDRLRAEWRSDRPQATRIDNLRGIGSGQRLNENYFLIAEGGAATVFDDGSLDVLLGGEGEDWFFASLAGVMDLLFDRTEDEVIDVLG